ncbi:hypothetical protein L9F63_011685, partial [Diploptera punctata]
EKLENLKEEMRRNSLDVKGISEELVQVQRVMDEMTREKERDIDELKAELQLITDVLAAKQAETSDEDILQLQRKLEESEKQSHQRYSDVKDLEMKLKSEEKKFIEAEKKLQQKTNELDTLKQDLINAINDLEQQKTINKFFCQIQGKWTRGKVQTGYQTQVSEFKLLKQQLEEIKTTNDICRKAIDEKDEELKSSQALLDAVNKQKDILISELQHKTKISEELEKYNLEYEKDINQKKDHISRLESEKAELLIQIEAGEGANTAIQQLSQEKVLLQNQLKEITEKHSKKAQDLDQANSQNHVLKRTNEQLTLQLDSTKNSLSEVQHNLKLTTEKLDKKTSFGTFF